MKITITKDDEGKRLDVYLLDKINETRSNISKHIKLKDILVNNKEVKSGYSLKENDEITINEWKETTDVLPEEMPLDIIFENDNVIVVNKPTGLVVHPGSGNKSGTLVNGLLAYTEELSEIDEDRPGIVHRIDKDTSGLLLISKNNEAHRILADDFKNKRIKRKYIALVSGVIKEDKGKINAPIGRDTTDRKRMMVTDKNSKTAITNFTVLERYKNATLIECILETGRTHQIRVHMAYIGHPIINDPVYNRKHIINDYGQMLHAKYIGFNEPITKEFLEFEVEPEKEFNDILETFKNS